MELIRVEKEKGFFKKGRIRVYKCNCGGEIKVPLNFYDRSNSGIGYCENKNCKAQIIIN